MVVSRRFLIDTDTASDDAVALIMALRAPDVRVLGITTVAGNVPVTQGTQNALYVTELCDAAVPVRTKMPVPMMQPMPSAVRFQGPSERRRSPRSASAWSASNDLRVKSPIRRRSAYRGPAKAGHYVRLLRGASVRRVRFSRTFGT